VQKVLAAHGASAIHIDHSSGIATMQIHRDEIGKSIAALIKAGVPARRADTASQDSWFKSHLLEIKVAVSAAATIPLMLHMVTDAPWLHNEWNQLFLALPVASIGLAHFGGSALRALRLGVANMDLLIVIGIAASFFYSLYGTLVGAGEDFLFYETAASITFFVLLGNFLEKRSLKKTSSAIEELTRLTPTLANRVAPDGVVEEVPVTSLRVGDLLLIREGERVPVDGTIHEGEALLDQSLITGESLPVPLSPGENALSGSVNTHGVFQLVVTGDPARSVLNQIIELVKSATARKPEIQRLGDAVSSVFVPSVFVIAVITFGGAWYGAGYSFESALLQAIAVLVVACPCAMGLATPTAVAVGIGRAAKSGLLVKGGSVIERLAFIDTVIFDKTGTLTDGSLSIDTIVVHQGERTPLLEVVKAMSAHSAHPISKLVVKSLSQATTIELQDVQEHRGAGLSARDAAGNKYKLGSKKYLGVESENDIILTKNDEIALSFSITDSLREGVMEAISDLKNLGKRLVVMSGDSERKVRAISEQLGLTEYHAELTPEEKQIRTHELTAKSRTAFIGDGINDAPSLAEATVGISLSGATAVAIQSAEVIVLNKNFNNIPSLFKISSLTYTTIKENLFWAFFYNSIAIPFAAFGFLTPLVAALTMTSSDIVVIGNSLRLKYRALTRR
jgi:Cu+-exporting ATPase